MSKKDIYHTRTEGYPVETPTCEQLESLGCVVACGKFWSTRYYLTERKDYDKLLYVYVEKGAMHLTYDGNNYIVNEGSAFFIDCHDPHIYGTHGNSCILTFIHFSGGSSQYFYKQIAEKRGYVHSGHYAQIIRKAIHDIADDKVNHSLNRVERLSYILTMSLYELLTDEPKADPMFEATVFAIKEAVNKSEQITVEELADIAGYSKFYFTRKFTEQYGISPYDFILRERLEIVKSQLINTDKSAGQIAIDCGFFDASHMSNLFKKREGMTPLQFRREWNRII